MLLLGRCVRFLTQKVCACLQMAGDVPLPLASFFVLGLIIFGLVANSLFSIGDLISYNVVFIGCCFPRFVVLSGITTLAKPASSRHIGWRHSPVEARLQSEGSGPYLTDWHGGYASKRSESAITRLGSSMQGTILILFRTAPVLSDAELFA